MLIGQDGKPAARPDHKVRLVCVKCSPHTSRSKYKGTSTGFDSDGVFRIATNLLDPPAEIIGLIYSERWAIEIFFRFFKHLLGCRHLLSHNQNGIEIQTYCAIIACLATRAVWCCALRKLVRLTATASRPRRVILTVDPHIAPPRPRFPHISANVVPNSIGPGPVFFSKRQESVSRRILAVNA